MFKRVFGVYVLFVIAFMAMHAFAQSPSPQPLGIDLNAQVDLAAQDFLAGKLAMGFAVVIMVLVYLFRQYLMPKISVSSALLPWISVGLGVILAVSASMAGGVPALTAVKVALLSGPLASQLWSMILKNVLHTGA